MHDPLLAPGHFLLDRVVLRECLFSPQEVAQSAGSPLDGEFARCSAQGSFQLSLPLQRPDLSRFNRLSLVVCNQSGAPLLTGVRFVHEHESEDVPCPAVSFTGGRAVVLPKSQVRLNFPAADFGWYNRKRSWANVIRIELSITCEKTYEGPREIEILIGPIEGETIEMPRGPRLTSTGLAEVLDGDLDDVLVNRLGAVDRFQPYTSEDLALRIPAPHQYPRGPADDILNGLIMGQRLPRPFPWDADPIGAHEWTHFLNRHHFIREMVRTFTETGNARYVRAIDESIADWIKANPVPIGSNGGAGPTWETLTAAWRLREWCWVVGTCWPHESFRRETKIAMLSSIWEHARSLMDHQGHPTNWIIVESAALALAGMCFPWFREAEGWRNEGLERLGRELPRQFLPDGVHFEVSPLYHAICVGALLEVTEAADIRRIALPSEFHNILNRSSDYLVSLCRPDFTWPSLNDSAGACGDYTALVHKAGQLLGREDLIWVGSRGRLGRRPSMRSAVFGSAGITVMRSGYEADANMLVFRTGPAGAAHVHADILSLGVTALGVPRLVDPGITIYAPGALTEYYRSPAAHSMVLVDECGPARATLPFRQRMQSPSDAFSWQRTGRIEVAAGLQAYPHPGATHEIIVARTVVFVGSRYWVIKDSVFGDGTHELTTCWQFAPGRVDIDLKDLTAKCLDARGPSFEIMPLSGPSALDAEVATGMLLPPRGWVSVDGMDVPAANVRFRTIAALPLCLIWVLMPYPNDSSPRARATRTDNADGGISVDILWKFGNKDRLLFDAPSLAGTVPLTARAIGSVIVESHGVPAAPSRRD